MSGSARRRRTRGGTFTVVALATSTLLVIAGSVFLSSTTHVLQLTGLETRRSRGREAAFAGIAWAARDAAATKQAEGRGTLHLDGGVRVTVLYRAVGADTQDLVVDAEASAQTSDEQPVKVTAVLARRGDGWVLSRFE